MTTWKRNHAKHYNLTTVCLPVSALVYSVPWLEKLAVSFQNFICYSRCFFPWTWVREIRVQPAVYLPDKVLSYNVISFKQSSLDQYLSYAGSESVYDLSYWYNFKTWCKIVHYEVKPSFGLWMASYRCTCKTRFMKTVDMLNWMHASDTFECFPMLLSHIIILHNHPIDADINALSLRNTVAVSNVNCLQTSCCGVINAELRNRSYRIS